MPAGKEAWTSLFVVTRAAAYKFTASGSAPSAANTFLTCVTLCVPCSLYSKHCELIHYDTPTPFCSQEDPRAQRHPHKEQEEEELTGCARHCAECLMHCHLITEPSQEVT